MHLNWGKIGPCWFLVCLDNGIVVMLITCQLSLLSVQYLDFFFCFYSGTWFPWENGSLYVDLPLRHLYDD
jgi:hypothetical protein